MDNYSVGLFRELFKGRIDDFAEQTDSGYIRVGRLLQDEDIFQHLKGDRSYGIYLIEPKDNSVWHTVIDIDSLDVSFMQKIINSALQLGLEDNQILKESSGNKGYHLWLIHNEVIPAEKAQRIGQIIVAHSGIERSIEVFPKQAKVSENGFGNLIKLPFGIHKKSGKRSYLLDNELKPILVWEDHLNKITKISGKQVDDILTEFDYLLPKPVIMQNNSETKSLPCFKKIMEEGVSEGVRDNVAFRFAIYLKNQGLNTDLTLSALRDWNRKNQPPLDDRIISEKVNSVFEHSYSGFGCEQDYMKEFCSQDCPIKSKKTESVVIETRSYPEKLPDFLKRDIPPLEYYISDLLSKKGKGMISAQANIGKSILSQNLALMMSSGKDKFLSRFDLSPARVLYLDLEMGESALKGRFEKMCAKEELNAENLFVRHEPSLNLLENLDKKVLEKWLADLNIQVLILDPLGNCWAGDPNDQQAVGQLTKYLNSLIDKLGISILIVHHWRKATRDQKSGGQMAAGSYRWEAWLDSHITLEGMTSNITITCQKNRHRTRFSPFLAKINEDLWFEFVADFERKYDESTLVTLFDSFNLDRVSVPTLIERSTKQGGCCETTLREIIKKTKIFEIDKTGTPHFLFRKGTQKGLLDV